MQPMLRSLSLRRRGRSCSLHASSSPFSPAGGPTCPAPSAPGPNHQNHQILCHPPIATPQRCPWPWPCPCPCPWPCPCPSWPCPSWPRPSWPSCWWHSPVPPQRHHRGWWKHLQWEFPVQVRGVWWHNKQMHERLSQVGGNYCWKQTYALPLHMCSTHITPLPAHVLTQVICQFCSHTTRTTNDEDDSIKGAHICSM